MPTTFCDRVPVELAVNADTITMTVEARLTLLDWLRDTLGLTGAKKGCNEGACGACTVLVDGEPTNGCLVLVAQCSGRLVTTIEGLADEGGELSDVQRAFVDHDAFQCGYCTPGQVLSATACVAAGAADDETSVREWMSGNICRCSAYPQIAAAVLDVGGRR